jgi:hypothetical protein
MTAEVVGKVVLEGTVVEVLEPGSVVVVDVVVELVVEVVVDVVVRG